MECNNCGSEYELKPKKPATENKEAIFCEVCGESLFSTNDSTSWEVKLTERFHKPQFNKFQTKS